MKRSALALVLVAFLALIGAGRTLAQVWPDDYTPQDVSGTNHGTLDANRVFFTKSAAAGTYYQAALGSAGQGYWLVEELLTGVQGLTKIGNWKMFYTSATGLSETATTTLYPVDSAGNPGPAQTTGLLTVTGENMGDTKKARVRLYFLR